MNLSVIRPCTSAALRLLAAMVFLLVTAAPIAAANANAPVKSITVTLDNDFPPYSFRGADGQLQGYLVDRWALWQAQTGVEVKLKAMDWAHAQELLSTGGADVIDTVARTPAREPLYDFSPPYTRVHSVLFMDKSVTGDENAASLKGLTVATKEGDLCVDLLRERGVTQIKLYPRDEVLLRRVAEEGIQVFCMNHQAANYLMYRDGHLGDYRATDPVFNAPFGWAVKRGNAAIYTLVADGFAAIDSARLDKLGSRWHVESPKEQFFAQYWLRITTALDVLAALLLVALTWSVMLRRRVTRQAKELRSALADLQAVNQQAQDARERLQAVVNAIPDLLFEMDAQGRYLRVHAVNEQLLAAPVAQLLGRSVRDVMPPDAADIAMAALDAAGETGYDYGRTYLLQVPDGGMRWFELSVARSKAATPNAAAEFVVLSRDVTRRKQVEAALEESEQRYRLVADNIEDIIWIFDLASKAYVFASPSVQTVLGFTPDEFLNRGPHNSVSPASQAAINAALPVRLKQFIAGDPSAHSLTESIEFVCMDGGMRTLEMKTTIIDDGHGSPTHLLGVGRDIGERLRKEAELRRLVRIIEQAPAAMLVVNLSGDIEYVNEAFLRRTGFARAELLGLKLHMLQSDQTPRSSFDALWATLRRGESWQGRFINRYKDGSEHEDALDISPVRDAAGRVEGYSAIFVRDSAYALHKTASTPVLL